MKPTTATWDSQPRQRSPASWQISTPHRWPNGRTCFGRCFRGCVMTGCTRSYAAAWRKLSLRNQALSTSAKISRDPATFEAGRPLEGHGWIIGVASAPAQRHLSPRPTAPSPPPVHPRGRAFSLGANTVFLPRTVPLYGRMGTPTLSTARYVKKATAKSRSGSVHSAAIEKPPRRASSAISSSSYLYEYSV